ncbi:MAG TPA: M1 family metallopeptidase [Steroidobacteraceae bacterium]|nr:M1 family metallopeptidase [Steroidobacteraceae bacterium]
MTGHGFARCAAAALLVLALPVFAATPPKRVVLPDAVTPEHYRIDFTPDIDALKFTGSVEIDVNVRRATNTIVLNAADLAIDSATLSGEAKQPTVTLDDRVQTATLTFDKPLATGPRKLKLVYHGTIYQSATGLFALDYQAPKGSSKAQLRALFTQFENSDARRFVPCWDEPGIKATFELSATLPAELMPISNMPVESTRKVANGGLQLVKFAKSPKMSTYLLFFGAGDFERVHRTVQNVDIGIVVKRGDTASAAYALDATAELLPYYNEYFGTPYPLPKLDLIAGPGSSQFFGAMENWGAIFYFEKYLLLDPKISTQSDKQYVYNVIAHEVAHQWFGDLVTMEWWDDLWLNEGFASWMANKATDHFNPGWKVWLQTVSVTHSVMQRDARDGTHAIIQPIEDVAQAANAFDDITYYKGAAVIRALESHVGEAAFRAGVRRYMREHKYGNTVTDDLWAAIGKESAAPVPQIAHDYTLQAGVPMVNMLDSSCAGGKTALSLNQTHFAIDADSTGARVWHLPVKVAVVGQAPTGAIVSGEKPTKVETVGCGAVVLNAGQAGYLRSHYSPEGFKAVAARYADLAADDQLGLLMDTQSLTSAAVQPMADYLDLTRQVPVSVDPVVASMLASQLQGMDTFFNGRPNQRAFRAYARGVLKPIFERVGWDARPGESDNTAILRNDLIAALNDLDDPRVIAETRARFEKFLANPESVSADVRSSLLRNVAVQADARLWERLLQMAKAAPSEMERQQLYGLLGAPQDDALMRRAQALALSGEVPSTVTPVIISATATRHPEAALDFTIQNWDRISKTLEVTSALQYVPRLTGNSVELSTVDKLNAFAATHVPENARQDYVLATARVRYLAKVLATRVPEVDRWLASH